MAVTNRPRREYSTTEFNYDAGTKVFTALVSDLPRFEPEQVYPDALDDGICLKSEKTQRLAWFALVERAVNRENELTHWVFKPTEEAVRANPGLKGTRVLVFND